MASKRSYVDEEKTPVYPIRWTCLLCWRSGRHEHPQTLAQAIYAHNAMVEQAIKDARISRLIKPGECAGDIELVKGESVKRAKQEKPPKIEFDGDPIVLK